MLGLFKKRAAPVVDVALTFAPSNRDISWKATAALFKKAAPSVTEEELEKLKEKTIDGDRCSVRLSKKGAKLLQGSPAVRVLRVKDLVELGEDHCRCGNTVCHPCTIDIKESINFSSTCIGIIPEGNKNLKVPKDLREDW